MSSSLSVVRGVAVRNLRGLRAAPPKMLPPLLVPLFFFASFKGALSGISNTKGFDYYSFTAFEFVVILYMVAMFTGVFTSIDVSIDFESGVARRLMAAAPRRIAIIGGYLVVSVGRCIFGLIVVSGVVVITGIDIRGGPLDLLALASFAILLNIATTLFGAGVALRFREIAAGSLVNIPVFVVIFLTPLFTPRDQLADWLQPIAKYNPVTPILESGRGFLANDPSGVGIAYASAFGLIIFFGIFAIRGMRKAEQAK